MRVVRIFFNADFRCQHDGLYKVAKAKKVDIFNLREHEAVVFINNARNKVKMFTSSGVLAYLRLEGSNKVDAATIAEIPRAFSGNIKVAYNRALQKTLKERMPARRTITETVIGGQR